jgi:hypothetical protein
MEAAIKEAQTLIGSFGTYARLVIVGVWFPGFLILCQASYIYFRLFEPTDRNPFSFIAEKLKQYDSNVVSTLIVVFTLSISIALGYVARDIAFATSDFWLRHKWPPARTLSTIFNQISIVYGEDRVGEVTRNYPVFRLVRGEVSESTLDRDPEAYVREFCKLWLKQKSPALNTEGLEIEINMVMGLVFPIAFAAVVFLVAVRGPLGTGLAILSLLAAVLMMYRITWARNIETEQAIVNFLFAHWEPAPPKPS